MLQVVLLFLNLLDFSIHGTVVDSKTKEPVAGANVLIVERKEVIISAADGSFEFTNIPAGNYTIQVNMLEYEPYQQSIVVTNKNENIIIHFNPKETISEEIVVTAIRANKQSPVTQFNMSQKDIDEKYFGHDVPFLLNNSPSINSYAESGVGIGYSYLRMRGIDQTRINMTVNGIPINDPETQGYYFNNFADLSNSMQSIQVQRGVGTSTNGAASFGGSINMVSNDLATKPSFGFQSGYGSFNSRRLSAEFNTGRINNKFAFYGRLSNIATDGYRIHSGSNIKSYFVSGAYFGKKSILKFNSFGGMENSQLAYNATPDSILRNVDRKYNTLTKDDNDQFVQTFNQLQYTYEFSKYLNIAASAYYVKGNGYFDLKSTYPDSYLNIADTGNIYGVARYSLDMNFLGAMAYLNYKKDRLSINYGIHANTFSSRHYMTLQYGQNVPAGIEPNYEGYSNTGYKKEISTFLKFSYDLTDKLILFADAQVRNTSFRYVGVDKPIARDTFQVDDMNWTFFNPKVGARYNMNNKVSFYATGGITTREPTRIDYLNDDRANFNVKQSDVTPERVFNVEVGNEIRTNKLKLNTNIYFMEFRNEIAATGAINFIGYSIRQNVPQSFRRGLELDWTWQISKTFALTNSSAFSWNKIKTYVQGTSIYDSSGANTYTVHTDTFNNVSPVLTPNIIINQGLKFTPVSWLNIEVIGKYVSKMYLDNTNNETLTTPDFIFADARISIKLDKIFKVGEHTLSFQLNNFTNTKYSSSGTPNNFYTQTNGGLVQTVYPSYYPAATRNYFVTLSMKF